MQVHEKCKLLHVFVYNSLQELMRHSQAHFTVLIQLQDFRQKPLQSLILFAKMPENQRGVPLGRGRSITSKR